MLLFSINVYVFKFKENICFGMLMAAETFWCWKTYKDCVFNTGVFAGTINILF